MQTSLDPYQHHRLSLDKRAAVDDWCRLHGFEPGVCAEVAVDGEYAMFHVLVIKNGRWNGERQRHRVELKAPAPWA